MIKIEHFAANQVLEQCTSTNDLAQELIDYGYPSGTWVCAKIQTSGRGRMERVWKSLEGNLFLSLLVQVQDKTLWSWIPITAAVGVVQALQSQFPKLDFRMKWPNDIWLNQAKIAGILCEGSGPGSNPMIIIGIGINCLTSPRDIDQAATDLSTAVEYQWITADEIRMPIISSVLAELDDLKEKGPAKVREFYERQALFAEGTSVEWGSPPQTGKVIGLGSHSELQVQSPSGKILSLYAEDVHVREKKLL
jgi:BirA family biotin operon repressor/biotin-[acetyl-CoA-carboxylase] ligase